MVIYDSTDPRINKYGRHINNLDFGPFIKELEDIDIPQEGVDYVPSVPSLEKVMFRELSVVFGGELDLELGFCAGHNTYLNALEYHRSSEVNVFATDAVLMLGLRSDIKNNLTYDTSLVEAFRFKKGEAFEVYATTLHYAPCGEDGNGFMVGVVLPAGTNYPLDNVHADITHKGNEDALLTAKNKWLIAHPEALSEKGHYPGLIGENLSI